MQNDEAIRYMRQWNSLPLSERSVAVIGPERPDLPGPGQAWAASASN
jgi:hypothetical protein